jgi:hypothetical protein
MEATMSDKSPAIDPCTRCYGWGCPACEVMDIPTDEDHGDNAEDQQLT